MEETLSKTLDYLQIHPQYVNLRNLSGLEFDLRYASKNNFMKRDIYGPFNEPFLHRDAAAKLEKAVENLRRTRPGWKFLIFDALRPRSAQQILWDHVKGTPHASYVADPEQGSMHNYGCALDLTVIRNDGSELDMGTEFDAFTELSEPQKERHYAQLGILTPEHLENRKILKDAMLGAGWIQLPHEWWHFNAFPSAEIKRRYSLIE